MARDSDHAVRRAAAVGLVAAGLLVAAALALPPLLGWEVHERADEIVGVPPLHGFVEIKVGPGTPLALLIGALTVVWGPRVAERLGWRALLLMTWVVGVGWLFGLALVDGPEGLSRVLGNPHEYLETARAVTSVPDLLAGFVDRIPEDAADNWPIHVAGHPPGMLLFFVGLDRLGLGGDLAAGIAVTLVASTLPLAVLVTLRALGREDVARRVAPFLVVTPAAVFLAVSADAVIAVVVAWGLATLALACRGGPSAVRVTWAVIAGLLLGTAVMMSYGMPLAGVLALAVLLAARRWWPLPVAVAAALVVAVLMAVGGFAWWEAMPVLRERYWDGIAADRPASYWWWGNLAALVISAGPALGASLGAAWASRRTERVPVLLIGAAALAVALADLSGMSKAEVERIWLPFVPWLTIGLALLPTSWRRPMLALQVGSALLVQHLLYTSW
ncbi:hypothetical protein FXB39_14915 [Nocardioides sp. BGMRC 2183]|nr:hypothetical protein FXB39_14915 [Nocardioides sp. BGMRC 2183]